MGAFVMSAAPIDWNRPHDEVRNLKSIVDRRRAERGYGVALSQEGGGT